MSNQISFQGSAEQRVLAEEIFKVMTSQGRFFANDAPIRQTLENLTTFFSSQRKSEPAQLAQDIDAAMRENGTIFQREEREGQVVYITARNGVIQEHKDDQSHMFRRRLYEPANPLPVDDISVVVTTTRPALTTVEPVFISDYWQQQAGILPPPGPEETELTDMVEELTVVGEQESVIKAEPEIAVPASVEMTPVEVPGTQRTVNTLITLPNGLQIDLRRSTEELMAQYGSLLTSQLRSAIEHAIAPQMVLFGNQVYPDLGGSGFGKNDLRRIRDYLLEAGEPLLDTQIMQDIFRYNINRPDYESFRFELNYRLSREKDFEFVGVEGARLWTTRGMPTIGNKRIKASEMGQLTGYLEEGFDDSLAEQSADSIRREGSLSHMLTFYEWEYGVLPLTRALSTLLPQALLSDQRTVVLRFEAPQHYSSTLVEMRFPTGNRGGWLQGLDGFFREYLVPGSLITITRTDNQHIFTITYEEQSETSDRLLVMDEKKNKLAFENITYYCATDSDMLVNQKGFGRLRNLKLFPMNERRKGALMLDHVFETIGEPVGTRSEPRYRANLQRLFVSMNVLRPASQDYLLHLLRDGDLFEQDEGDTAIWYYTPPPAQNESDDEDEDEDEFYDEDDE